MPDHGFDLLIEILGDLATLAGREDVEWADDIHRKIERLRETESDEQ